METQQSSNLVNRFFATLIDYIIIVCFFVVYAYKYGDPNETGGYTVNGLKSLIPIVFWFAYLIVIESLFNATAGHYLFGLKVVKENGTKIDFVDSLKRHIIDPIDFFFFGIPALICIKNTKLNQRLGDLLAKTIVITDKE